jgi:hypothetical protein
VGDRTERPELAHPASESVEPALVGDVEDERLDDGSASRGRQPFGHRRHRRLVSRDQQQSVDPVGEPLSTGQAHP